MRKLPQFMPESGISYMDFDLDELIAASYNWCEQGANGLERDSERHPEERANMLNMAADLRQIKRRLAEALDVMYPMVLGRMWREEEERKINQCMAL
jgi:pyrroloquinoline quinone (PQQ) biosynthesis protein C